MMNKTNVGTTSNILTLVKYREKKKNGTKKPKD
jgi:hypothetical protein